MDGRIVKKETVCIHIQSTGYQHAYPQYPLEKQDNHDWYCVYLYIVVL